MIKEDKVSIIIPVYNVAPWIMRAYQSIKNQLYSNYEVIFIDDGSTDSSLVQLEEISKSDAKVKVIHQENKGVGMARNVGLAYASGKYIYFMDPDDIISPYLLSDNMQLLSQNPADMLIFNVQKVENSECLNYKFTQHPVFSEYSGGVEYIASQYEHLLRHNNLHSPCNKLYSRSFLMDNGVQFNTMKYGEDAIFNICCFKYIKKLITNTEIYYLYVNRKGSATDNYDKERIESFYKISLCMNEYLNEENKMYSTLPLREFLSFIWRSREYIPHNFLDGCISFVNLNKRYLNFGSHLKLLLLKIRRHI